MADHTDPRHLDVIGRAFDAIAAGDADELVTNYTDDYFLELPYADPPKVVVGRDEVREYLRAAFGVFRFRLIIDEVFPTGDPDMVVVEYTSEGEVVATGAPYRNSYIGLYWFREGQICRLREYYNPVLSARSLAARGKGDS
jgi:ketosteroid isomerase-like protein